MDGKLIEQMIDYFKSAILLECVGRSRRVELKGWRMVLPYGKVFNVTTQCGIGDYVVDIRFSRDGEVLRIGGYRRVKRI